LRFHLFVHCHLILLDIVPECDLPSAEGRDYLGYSGTLGHNVSHQQFSVNAKVLGTLDHGPGHKDIRSFFFSLGKDIASGTTGQSHHSRTSPRQVSAAGTGILCSLDHWVQIFIEFIAALWLVHLVLHTKLQVVKVAAAQRMNQHGCSSNIESGFLTGDGIFQYTSSIGSLSNKVRNEHNHLQARWARNTFRHPPMIVKNTKLNAPIDDWRHIIRVALTYQNKAGSKRKKVQ
jgi:hypothetical protein